MAQLKELVDIYLGVTHTPEYVENGVPFLSVKDISGGKICFDDCKYISEEEYNGLSQGAKPQVGDMLFCRVGTIGKPIIIPEGTPLFGSFVSLGYLRNRNANKCNLEYLRYWMYSKAFERQVYANVKGASQVNLNTGWLSKFEVALPDIVVQEDIVKKLDKCASVINKRKQELEELDNLIKSQFVEMFGDPVINPFGWEQVTLKEVAVGKLSYGSGASATEYDGKCRYIRITDITDSGELNNDVKSPDKYDEKYLLQEGDILFARSGATVGKTFRYSEEKHGKGLYAGYLIRLIPNKEKVIPDYVFYYTKTEYYASFVKKAQRAVAQPNINAQEYGDLTICVPPISLQKEFMEFVEQVTKLKFEVQKSLDETQTLMDSLMQQYFG